MEKLKELARHSKMIEEREKLKKEIRDEDARPALVEQKHREAIIRYDAVSDYKALEKIRRADEEQRRKHIERDVRVQIEVELGQSLEQVKAILSKAHS